MGHPRRLIHGLDYGPLALALHRPEIWPITAQVCQNLRAPAFSSDPADELIAATSLTHDVPLVTRDARIQLEGNPLPVSVARLQIA